MPTRRFWDGVQGVIRFFGWLNSVAALVCMAYVINKWPKNGGAVAAAMVGTGVAMLNDSWEMVSIFDSSRSFVRLSHTRVLMHDLFSLALTVGGIVLVLFSETGPAYMSRSYRKRDMYDQDHMTHASLYLLAGVVGWRFVFAIFSCLNTSQASRRARTVRTGRTPAEARRDRRRAAAAQG